MPELQERERRKRERQLNKKKKQPIDDGSYRPRAWDEEEPEQRSFASGLKSTVSSVLPRNKLKFSPSDVPTDTAQRQNPNVGTYVNPETPYSSHIDNNFDVDQFIAEEAKKDRQEKSAEAEQEAKYNYKDLDTII
ncbi:hypothetical protein TRVA0_032S00782 [Trichomonascus vanleenenianus]|uniref:uncharacterized protein n=1 Tax=Trichomonascus vanleenenianus TaxID=2268995 RepID=UPI003ECA9661